MTDDLIASLAKTAGLRVIGATSVFVYKNRPVNVATVAESLGVAHVLEGAVQKDGDRLRVRVRLIDARDGATRWSEKLVRELRDVFAVQDEISHAVAQELGLRLGLSAANDGRRQPTRSVAAYELYTRGNDRTLLRSDSAVRVGLEFFRQAITLDSNYAAAWAGLGRMYSRLAGVSPPATRPHMYELAENAARKAVALDDSLDEAHATLGVILMSQRDFAEAGRELERAIALNSSKPLTHQWISGFYIWMGQLDEGLSHAQLAHELDPLSADATADLARALAAADRCDEALVQLKPLASLKTPLLRAAPIMSQCYARKGMWAEAAAAIRPQVERGELMAKAQLASVLARGGHRDEALRIRESLLDDWRRGKIGAFPVAFAYVGSPGEAAHAFEWLDKSIDDGSISGAPGSQAVVLLTSPDLEEFRRDARFVRFRNRLGLPAQKR
jgi:tetratricopeptide (TPR) repeat protein